jgi:hypothetical protein
MRIKKYISFILENLSQSIQEKLSDDNKEIKIKILELISKSINIEDTKLLSEFLDSFIRNPEESKIEGLINDSDIYEFYEDYSNEIDEILSKTDFYEKKPSEIDSFSLYKYTVKGTLKAIGKLIEAIKSELLSDVTGNESVGDLE